MRALIRRLMDVARLSAELERAEARIKTLEAELKGRLLGPSWQEVAKDFDARALLPEIKDQMMRDLRPILNREAVNVLTTALRDDGRGGWDIRGAVAWDQLADVIEVEFDVRASTRMRVAAGMMRLRG